MPHGENEIAFCNVMNEIMYSKSLSEEIYCEWGKINYRRKRNWEKNDMITDSHHDITQKIGSMAQEVTITWPT
jgi:hypothetical protein